MAKKWTIPAAVLTGLADRRTEFVRPRWMRIKTGTWNVAGLSQTGAEIADWFVGCSESECGSGAGGPISRPGLGSGRSTGPNDDVDLYVLGLQEIVDIASPAEALRPFTDPTAAVPFKSAVEAAMPGLRVVAEQQLVGLLVIVWATPAAARHIRAVQTGYVGTGLMGYLGNKGGVAVRVLVGESAFVFVNVHLAAGDGRTACERRDWDVGQVLTRMRFANVDPFEWAHPGDVSPGTESGERDDDDDSLAYGTDGAAETTVGDEDAAFLIGDLNYRLTLAGSDVRTLLGRHQDEAQADGGTGGRVDDDDPEEWNAAEMDPGSLQTTIESLLAHDELTVRLGPVAAVPVSGVTAIAGPVSGRAQSPLAGWREGRIRFGPTYKFDVGSVDRFDSSVKQRGPGWCDRVLWRTRADREAVAAAEDGRVDAGLDVRAGKQAGVEVDPTAAYDYDDDDFSAGPGPGEKPGETVVLEDYTSHPHAVRSDHKPVTATFLVRAETADEQLWTDVCRNVRRELDRAENERRPSVTVLVDGADAVEFGRIPVGGVRTGRVTVANTGPVAVAFSVVAGGGRDRFPDWLHTQPVGTDDRDDVGMVGLAPGESREVDVVGQADSVAAVRSLNQAADGTGRVDDVVVVRLVGGRDYFVPVTADWSTVCLGWSVADLVRAPDAGVATAGPTAGWADQPRRSAPAELFRLVELVEQLVRDGGGDHGSLSWPFNGNMARLDEYSSISALVRGSQPRPRVDSDGDVDGTDDGDRAAVDRLVADLSANRPVDWFGTQSGSARPAELAATVLAVMVFGLGGLVGPAGWEAVAPAVKAAGPDVRTRCIDRLTAAQEHSDTVALLVLAAGIGRLAGLVVDQTQSDGPRPCSGSSASPSDSRPSSTSGPSVGPEPNPPVLVDDDFRLFSADVDSDDDTVGPDDDVLDGSEAADPEQQSSSGQSGSPARSSSIASATLRRFLPSFGTHSPAPSTVARSSSTFGLFGTTRVGLPVSTSQSTTAPVIPTSPGRKTLAVVDQYARMLVSIGVVRGSGRRADKERLIRLFLLADGT